MILCCCLFVYLFFFCSEHSHRVCKSGFRHQEMHTRHWRPCHIAHFECGTSIISNQIIYSSSLWIRYIEIRAFSNSHFIGFIWFKNKSNQKSWKKNTIAKWKYAWFVLLSTISIKENDFLFCSKKGNSYFCSFLESHKTQFVCLIFFLLLNFVHLIILLICDKNKWQYWWYFCEIYLTTPSCFVLFFNLEPTENKWRCNVHIKERF